MQLDSSLKLLSATSTAWLTAVLEDFDSFLLDHAANERKASSMALSMVVHYPDKPLLVEKLIDLAIEELHHFRQVVKIIYQRGLQPSSDKKDPYVNQLGAQVRKNSHDYFLDRLLMAAVIEARGAERFALIAKNIGEPAIQAFYESLSLSEDKHHLLFVELAEHYFKAEEVRQRLDEWLIFEKNTVEKLHPAARLH